MAGPDQIAQRHQPVAFGAQLINNQRQRGDGLVAVAAAIVQQHHIAAVFGCRIMYLRQRSVDDCLHSGPSPVARINVQAYDCIAQLLRNRRGLQLVFGGWFGIAKIRRAKQAGRTAGIGFDQALGGVEFKLGAERGDLRQIWMGITVVADLKPVSSDAPQDLRMPQPVFADYEKCGGGMLGLQHIENARGKIGVGSIVKG